MKKVLMLTAVALLSACAQPNNSGSVYRASQTQNESAIAALLENLRRYQRGEPLHGEIDRSRGY